MMETLSTFEIDKFFNSENKKKTFQEKNAITNFFTNSTNSIINNSNLKLQILQDIKRRDEIRELYNTYKHRELRKNIYIEKYESSTIRLVDNINNKTLTENDFNESEYKDETKIINETKNYNDKNNDDIININSYKISGRMKSNEPMPLHELNNIQYKPIFPNGKKCVITLPLLMETKCQETFYITKDIPEEKESNVDKNHHFEPYIVYNEFWDEIPVPRTVNNCAPPLLFDSRFESGNLQKAIRIDDYAYFLQLKCDLNTNGHVQWFFFQVKNMQGNHEYQFTLGNFTKPKSLFNNGMKVLVYSKKKKEKENIGWYRTGYNISYTKNKKCSNFKQTYLLDMSIVFTEDNDTCYIAYCYPYTYSDLQRDINILKMDNKLFNVLNHEIIGESINKNKIDLITITNNRINNENKKVIIITGRVHPCETNSSFMVKGFIEFMIGNTKEAQYIRDNYIVKIIPMLNPDGVISGNSRCSLTGYDLNRCWRLSEKKLIRYTPEIHTVIKMIEKTLENNSIEMFVDMHGHSRKFGTFLYGCSNDDNEDNRYKERIFPYIFSNYYKQYVYFNRCHFNIEKVKEGTGRVTMHKKYNVLKSYTMEASMCGSDLTSTKGIHYSMKILSKIGKSFGKTIFLYFKNSYDNANYERILLKEIKLFSKEKNDDSSENSDMSSDDENSRKIKKKEQKLKKIDTNENIKKVEKLDKKTNSYNKQNSLENTTNKKINKISIIEDIACSNKLTFFEDNKNEHLKDFIKNIKVNQEHDNKKNKNIINDKPEPIQYIALAPKNFDFTNDLLYEARNINNNNKMKNKNSITSQENHSKIFHSNPNINKGLIASTEYNKEKMNRFSNLKSQTSSNFNKANSLDGIKNREKKINRYQNSYSSNSTDSLLNSSSTSISSKNLNDKFKVKNDAASDLTSPDSSKSIIQKTNDKTIKTLSKDKTSQSNEKTEFESKYSLNKKHHNKSSIISNNEKKNISKTSSISKSNSFINSISATSNNSINKKIIKKKSSETKHIKKKSSISKSKSSSNQSSSTSLNNKIIRKKASFSKLKKTSSTFSNLSVSQSISSIPTKNIKKKTLKKKK